MDLDRLLLDHRTTAVEQALAGLSRAALPHYSADAEARSHARLERLYDLSVECLANHNLMPICEHARVIAHERHGEGFSFHEVHTAFNVLEEVIWRVISDHMPPDQLFAALAQASTVLGAGKEALAVAYVSLAGHPESRQRLDVAQLFKGTA